MYFCCVVVGRARARMRGENDVACSSLGAQAKQSRAACASVWIASSLSLLAMTSPREMQGVGYSLFAIRYSLFATRPSPPSTCAAVPEPDRPNEKDSSMSSGLCLK